MQVIRNKRDPSQRGHTVCCYVFKTQQDSLLLSVSLSFCADALEFDPELAQLGSLGFTGCLSAVLFNSISPLKAALLNPNASPVVVSGPLLRSSCLFTPADPSAAETIRHQSGQRVDVSGSVPAIVNTTQETSIVFFKSISTFNFSLCSPTTYP